MYNLSVNFVKPEQFSVSDSVFLFKLLVDCYKTVTYRFN
jgi:hypothetical protein